MEELKRTAPNKNTALPKPPKALKTKQFLPIVFTSRIARNRLDEMRKDMSNIRSMNPNRFTQ